MSDLGKGWWAGWQVGDDDVGGEDVLLNEGRRGSENE